VILEVRVLVLWRCVLAGKVEPASLSDQKRGQSEEEELKSGPDPLLVIKSAPKECAMTLVCYFLVLVVLRAFCAIIPHPES